MADEIYKKAITLKNLNPAIVELQYSIYGPMFRKVQEISKDINAGKEKQLKRVISANIGDCQALGQVPVTFIRQVSACISYPKLLELEHFPEDVKVRVSEILDACNGHSIGSYPSSIGIELIRKSVSAYIEKRDGYKVDWENVCLCPGATGGIKASLQMLANNIDGRPTGVMVPIPEYPLYSATVVEYGLTQVNYYLDEAENWGLNLEELERSFKEGSKTSNVRALVVINPGNPTGQILSRMNIECVIKFAYRHSLLIIADEVYQHNVYDEEFISFKKVLVELGSPFNQVELISFMSMSKGYMGECGLRGGWMELVNIDPDVQFNLYKGISARVCPNTVGQTVVDCVARPPIESSPSYELYFKEKNSILQSLRMKARIIEDMFKQMDGISCTRLQGAMYAFPRLEIPQKAIEEAMKLELEADMFYAIKLLEETGICVVPGSGFGQVPGTYHVRFTILPELDIFKEMVEIFQKFHHNFIRMYS